MTIEIYSTLFFNCSFLSLIDQRLKCQINGRNRSAQKRKTYADSYGTEEHENIKKRKRVHEREISASIFGSQKHDKIKQ